MSKRLFIIILIQSFLFSNSYAKDKIQHIEPANWWVGMHNPNVQLLLYGDDIGSYNVRTDYNGVLIKKISRVENNNYLFVDLVVEENATSGVVDFEFLDGKKVVEKHTWPLLKRKMQGVEYQGFTNSDVLYLITPDRYANGNEKNDAVAGLTEQPNRSFHGGRHGGDIEGLRMSLDYIKDMGFTTVWLNPVLENNMAEYSYHGYSTTDFYKVDPRYGSNEDYQKYAEEARSKGIKLIMDMIVNHCGLEHWWMKDLPSKDFINQWDEYTGTSHRKTILQDPYAAASEHKIFTDGWFVPSMPDLNQRNEFMARYLIQNSIWWVEYLGLAGIRMDTYPYPDMDFMTDWTEELMAEYPNLNIVGEEWYEGPAIVSYWQRGKDNANGYTSELPSLMDFPLQAALAKGLTAEESWGEGLIKLYSTLAMDFLYPDPENLVVFPDNHDMSRIYTQLNHDYGLFKIAMAHTLTTRGIPQLYYGTEILMKNPDSGEHGVIRSDFPGGWKDDKVNAFTGKGLSNEEKSAQQYLKRLLNWRQTATSVHTGKLTHYQPKNGIYVYFRYDNMQKIMVILNKNKEESVLALSPFAEMIDKEKTGTDVATGKAYQLGKELKVPARDALILELK